MLYSHYCISDQMLIDIFRCFMNIHQLKPRNNTQPTSLVSSKHSTKFCGATENTIRIQISVVILTYCLDAIVQYDMELND